MITVGKHRVRSYMTMEFDFAGIRIIEKELSPVQWKLNVKIAPSQKKRVSDEILARNTESAYQRIYFWMETNLPNIIVVGSENITGLAIAHATDNAMMLCPAEPFDELLIELLHSKFTALASGNLVIGEITLRSSDTTATYSFDCPDGLYALPMTVTEYVPALSLHRLPWWARNDGFCYEFLKPADSASVTNEEYFGKIEDPMSQFESAMDELLEDYPGNRQAEIIQVEKWKPQKI